ncbi:MAG: esterase [Pirellulales bacterium]|nr:esterase [Pirellulales bacterium]
MRPPSTSAGASVGHWQHTEIGGHPCQLFLPAKPSIHRECIIYLHDQQLTSLAERPAFEALFERYGLPCVAPQTGRSWWTDRIWPGFDPQLSAERFVVDRVMPWLAAEWEVQPPGIALLGVGMGGQGALRMAYKRPDVFPVVAAISPTIDYQFAMEAGDMTLNELYRDVEQARQDTATLHVHPLNWPRNQWFACDPLDYPWHDSADRLRMKLYSLGVPFEADLETGRGGHSWEYFDKMAEPALRFIVERLERERLRIV